MSWTQLYISSVEGNEDVTRRLYRPVLTEQEIAGQLYAFMSEHEYCFRWVDGLDEGDERISYINGEKYGKTIISEELKTNLEELELLFSKYFKGYDDCGLCYSITKWNKEDCHYVDAPTARNVNQI